MPHVESDGMYMIVRWLRFRVRHGTAQRAQNQFNAAGDANLVENAEKIILDRVRAEPQLGCNFTVAQTIRRELDDCLLAPRRL